MKNVLEFQNELLDQVITSLKNFSAKEQVQNIIIDAVIFERVSSAMNKLLRVFDPNEQNTWEPANEYFGVYNSFNALGLKHPSDFDREKIYLSLTDPLLKIFEDVVKKDMEDQNKKTAEDLAKVILLEWEFYVNKVRLGKIKMEVN